MVLVPALPKACDPNLRVWFGFVPNIGQYLYHEVVMEMKRVNFKKR